MTEMLIQTLKDLGIGIYSIEETLTEGVELYFIKRNLDMRRRTEVSRCSVTVYRDFEENGEQYRGQAKVVIANGMTREEIAGKLSDAYYSASFVKAKWYPIPDGKKDVLLDTNLSLNGQWDQMPMQLAEAAYGEEERFRKEASAAGQEADTVPFLNSFEIFAKKTLVHILNSQGADVSYIRYLLNGEFVAQCLKPQDVEIYEDFQYDSFCEDEIRARVRRILERTRDRAGANQAAPAGTYRLILSDKHVPELMSFFRDRSSAAAIYQKYSGYQLEEQVQSADREDPEGGELLTITLNATVPYSEEGIPMKDRVLLKDGVLKTIHGGSRFCYYLGVESTGEYTKITVNPGSVSLEELKKQPYLHVVNFSDFQMDALSGNFGGEIRLGYLFDGQTVTCVTGGSVNGSILSAQKHLLLSGEMQNTTAFAGPLAVCMEGITVAGL